MDETMRDKGRRNRTEVLGADHVERATASVDDFDRGAGKSSRSMMSELLPGPA